MGALLYNIIIFPLEKIMELSYLFFTRVFHNPVISLFGISFSITLLTLPLYFCAEKWQRLERETQKRLSAKAARIKEVFSGDERFMILSAYYRQNHYHPIFALRSSFSLLIQVPFFIAAYSFLTNYDVLQGVSFFFVSDLGRPDRLLPGGINLLPCFMTLINCISCMIYTKDFPVKEKIQLYGMAAVFLVLLYNSPSGLVIYWTLNNIFSLIKNILQNNKYAKKIIYFTIYFIVVFLDIYVLFIRGGVFIKKIVLVLAVSTLFFLPLFEKLLISVNRRIERGTLWASTKKLNAYFFPALICLFLLSGFAIPLSLIASSVSEFSFIEQYSSPFPFVFTVLSQAAGIFLFWPLCIYFIFSKRIKFYLTAFTVFILFGMLINVFLFPGSYGTLTNMLSLSDPGTWLTYIPLTVLNLAVLAILFPLLIFLFSSQKGRNILFSVEVIMVTTLLLLGIVNSFFIYREYTEISKSQKEEGSITKLSPVYNLSSTGENVVILMLDRGISGFVPFIFEEKPELNGSLSGFTWYPNCVSFGRSTIFGFPSLMGGYEYTPLSMQQNSKTISEKIAEASLLMPRIFTDNGYKAVITDSWTDLGGGPDLHVFDPYPEITGKNINSSYTDFWLRNHPDVNVISIVDFLNDRLIRFSLFRTAPLILRLFIYDRGHWLSVNNVNKKLQNFEITNTVIGKYAVLDYLPELTNIDTEKSNNLMIVCNTFTHDPVYLQSPDYIPVTNVMDKGNGVFADDPFYHVNMAAFLLLAKWFDYLKENNAYDNTRIIIVSDHGFEIKIDPNSFSLPDGRPLETFVSLLLVKDFNDNGGLTIDNTFMTQADVPLFAMEGIVNNPVNPFSGSQIKSEKGNGAVITNSTKTNVYHHGKNTFTIRKDEWLTIHDDIFNPENWERVER